MADSNHLTVDYRRFYPTLILAVLCAAAVILLRFKTETVIHFAGINFAYTDIFLILCAGIGGMESGLIAFVILSVAEFMRIDVDFNSLYSVVIYLMIIIITARLAYIGIFRSLRKTILSAVMLAFVLAVSWRLSFDILLVQNTFNIYSGVPISRLFIGALPETLFACIVLYLYFRYMPDPIKRQLGSGWKYTKEGKNIDQGNFVLGIRLTILSLVEAILLCIVAIIISNLSMAAIAGKPLSWRFMADHWKENLRMGLLMLSAAVPIIYLMNEYIRIHIIDPIDVMSILMDRYFETEPDKRNVKLPELYDSKDEIGKLYQSLGNMVDDMGDYIDKLLAAERRSIHLTEGFMLALAKAVDAKDRYTSGHSERVAKYSKEIAARMGKSVGEQQQIYTMGLLHDIGKIGVPESIINKNGRLTDEEFAKIKEHPIIGYDILKNVSELPGLATGARWHHERFDGRGYPDGLSGMDIPEEARIIAVADAYDAMTSNRAYSSIRPQETVRAEIERCKGSQFDEKIADIMLSMIDDDKEYQMCEQRNEDAEA